MEAILAGEHVRHDEEDESREEDEDEEEEEGVDLIALPPQPITQPTIRSYGNTGPKGVLADHAAHQELKRIQREIERLKVEYMVKKAALGSRSEEQVPAQTEQKQQTVKKDHEGEKEGEIEEEEEEDDFFEEYKKRRMAEIKASAMYFKVLPWLIITAPPLVS